MIKNNKMWRFRRFFEAIFGVCRKNAYILRYCRYQLNVIFRHIFNVIFGLRSANLDPRGRLCVTLVDDSKVECVTSGNDYRVVQSGRSMIEMLGVLAIIGVLSVGGIAGYSKAMTQFKIDKTIEQISSIAQGVKSSFALQGDYYGLYCAHETSEKNFDGCLLVKDLNLATTDLYSEGGNPYWLYNAWNGEIKIAHSGLKFSEIGRGNNKAYNSYTISYSGLPKDACVAIGSKDWSVASNLVGMVIQQSGGTTQFYKYLYEGCKGWSSERSAADILAVCSKGEWVGFPASLKDVSRVCTDDSTIHLKFR